MTLLYIAYSYHQFLKFFSAPTTNCPSFKFALDPPLFSRMFNLKRAYKGVFMKPFITVEALTGKVIRIFFFFVFAYANKDGDRN